ncbi:MAG TPA: ATP-binding protein [Streptosporangiaceae bacterium]
MARGTGAPRAEHRKYGRLGLQLALLLVFVAVGAIVVAIVVASRTVVADAQELLHRQEANEAEAIAQGAGVTYHRLHWAQALEPVFVIGDRSGTAILVKDAAGRPVRASPDYATFPSGPVLTRPIIVSGLKVGSVTLKFDDHGIGALIGHFEAQRWRARAVASAFGALFALIVALLVAPLLVRPVDRLLTTARARGAGRPQSRVGPVKGLRNLRELAATFDQMADTLDQQDQLRRDLVANVAHELRTPIAVLQASTEAMVDGLTPLTIENVRSLHEEAVRLGQMTDDLERLASAEAAALELTLIPCDLAEVAEDAATSLAGIFEAAGVRLVRRTESAWAPCDPARLREVITNLLTNAAKFTPAGGEVTLATRAGTDAAVLTVTDTGIGVSADELPRLRERFYRGRESAEVSGSGIGLAIVDELVRAHQASMDIESRPSTGTRVTIRLPLLPEPPGSTGPPGPSRSPRSPG